MPLGRPKSLVFAATELSVVSLESQRPPSSPQVPFTSAAPLSRTTSHVLVEYGKQHHWGEITVRQVVTNVATAKSVYDSSAMCRRPRRTGYFKLVTLSSAR